MNRRTLPLLLAGLILVPTSLMSAPAQKNPMRPQLHIPSQKASQNSDKCNCKKGCKCKPSCCQAGRPSSHARSPRGFDGRTPNFQPPRSKPTRGFDGRTPSFGPPSRSRSFSDNRSPDRESRYKEIISKFDKNKDGKLNEKEKEEAKKHFISKYRNHGK